MSYLPRPPDRRRTTAAPVPGQTDAEREAIATGMVNLDDYERAAAERIDPAPLAYFAGGARDERTLADNRAAFARRRFLPRVLSGVAEVDLGVTLLGRRWPVPIWIAPTALNRMAHPDGELAVARAAAARDVTFTLSSSASTDMAEVEKISGPHWFQVYLLADPGARRAMLERAVASGHEALMLTVDVQRLGGRERDVRAGFRIPDAVTLPNIAVAAGVPLDEAPSVQFKDGLDWHDLEWVAGFGLPVIVKGVLHADDARLAAEYGAAVVCVSNHGGRQLDGSIASLDALPAVVEAVGGRVPVLLDGGVRRGTDALIAMTLGATAIGIGRPILWGLAVDGEAGVGRVLDLLTDELEMAMALAGASRIADLTPDLLA